MHCVISYDGSFIISLFIDIWFIHLKYAKLIIRYTTATKEKKNTDWYICLFGCQCSGERRRTKKKRLSIFIFRSWPVRRKKINNDNICLFVSAFYVHNCYMCSSQQLFDRVVSCCWIQLFKNWINLNQLEPRRTQRWWW